MAFDPDQYLAQKAPPQAQGASGGFDPDSYLAAKTAPAAGQQYASPIGPNPTLAEAPMAWAKKIGYGDDSHGTITDNGAPKPVEGVAPSVVPAASLGAPGMALAKFMGRTGAAGAATRFAANAGVGAATHPEDRGMGALIGGGLSLAGEALPLIPAAAKWVGGKMAKMSQIGREGYVANPEMGEAAYNQFKTDPQGFQQSMADKVKQGQQAIYENNIQPQKQAIKMGLMGQEPLEVGPNQFKGASRDGLMDRLKDQVGRDAATKAGEFPDQSSRSMSPEDPTRVTGPSAGAEAAPSSPPPSAEPQVIGNDGMPLQQTPPPQELPSTVRVSRPTLMDMEEASGKAAKFKASPYGLDNGPGAANEASDNSILNDLLGPEYQKSTAALAPAARTGSMLGKMLSKNPSRILNTSNAIGATPIRAARQMIQEAGGPDLEALATSMQGAKELNDPNRIHGLMNQLVTHPIGATMVRATPTLQGVAAAGRSAVPWMLKGLSSNNSQDPQQ